jgi:hypothetical protein
MVGATPIFYRYIDALTTTQRDLQWSWSVPDPLKYSMQPLENRRIVFQCFEALRFSHCLDRIEVFGTSDPNLKFAERSFKLWATLSWQRRILDKLLEKFVVCSCPLWYRFGPRLQTAKEARRKVFYSKILVFIIRINHSEDFRFIIDSALASNT